MKVLVVRFSSIGDIVLTTPVVRCLSQKLNAEVHFLTKEVFTKVLENNPYITKIWTIKKDISEVLESLIGEKFDLMIDLHNNLRTFRLKQKLSTAHRSFNKVNIQKWLMTNFKINKLPEKHIVDRYMETITSFAIKNDGEGLDFFFSAKSKSDVESKLTSFAFDKKDKDSIIGFVIGAAHQTKCLPIEKQIELINKLAYNIILIGGPNEKELAQIIVQNSNHTIFNTVGEFSIEETAACISICSFVITHDTGAMHISAALKKPMAVIWGNTIPEFGMGPYYGNETIVHKNFEVEDLNCRPCSKIGYDQCPKKHFKCMNDQNLDEIVHFVHESLNKK